MRLPGTDREEPPIWRPGKATGDLIPCNPDTEIAVARQALENRWFVTFASLVASGQWTYASLHGTELQKKELALLADRLETIPAIITVEDILKERDLSARLKQPKRWDRFSLTPAPIRQSKNPLLRLIGFFAEDVVGSRRRAGKHSRKTADGNL